MTTASDHSALISTLPSDRITKPPSRRIIVHRSQLETFCNYVAERAEQLKQPTNVFEECLDNAAASLTDLVNAAIRASGKTPPGPSQKQEIWRTEECESARTAWHYVRRYAEDEDDGELAEYLHKEFKKTVWRARRERSRSFFDQVTEPSDINKVTRWLRPASSFQPPPLQVGDRIYESQLDRAHALRQATLERKTAAGDITRPWKTPVTIERTIQLTTEVTNEQEKWAATCTGNTSPGVDNITVDLLKACWPQLGA